MYSVQNHWMVLNEASYWLWILIIWFRVILLRACAFAVVFIVYGWLVRATYVACDRFGHFCGRWKGAVHIDVSSLQKVSLTRRAHSHVDLSYMWRWGSPYVHKYPNEPPKWNSSLVDIYCWRHNWWTYFSKTMQCWKYPLKAVSCFSYFWNPIHHKMCRRNKCVVKRLYRRSGPSSVNHREYSNYWPKASRKKWKKSDGILDQKCS